MNEKTKIEIFSALFQQKFGIEPSLIDKLPPSGSYREYYRLTNGSTSAIAAYNEDRKENDAFVYLTRHFFSKGLPVPEMYGERLDSDIYLLEDLGDDMLLSFMEQQNYYKYGVNTEIMNAYKKVLELLPKFQVEGTKDLDYSVCYPRYAFDRQSMMWDLNYFKYYFLKLSRVAFNEQHLEDDFNTLCDHLLSADCNYFLYRDFQSRNIMLKNGEPYFIDYQGGRKGSLHYDIGSILFEAKTHLPAFAREELLDHYLVSLQKVHNISREAFMEHYYGYVYIRMMQAMGAYGFRGLYEKKPLFLQSIPPVLSHLEWLVDNVELPIKLPELTKVWRTLVESDYLRSIAKSHFSLTVNINSFSYRRGIPVDESANGGGFVFDCRSITNPGKYEQYKNLCGTDAAVIEFLEKDNELKAFLNDVYSLADRSIEKYLERGFTSLMINFGCTGGQHRSVYAAEMLRNHLLEKFARKNLILSIRHREMEMRNNK
jgi:RNase adaptor protein for sRNA GlmZ degradation